jgi:beta-phosphoglucomutase-like phosphatase (HAD superfamily)
MFASSTMAGKDVATIKAVIFDLDGTLLDTESLSCRAVIESFALTGLTIPSEIYTSLNDGGLLLPWELKRQILGLRGSG